MQTNKRHAEACLDHVISHLEAMQSFWKAAHGWAPQETAELLANARLDRVVVLAKCLKIWLVPNTDFDNDPLYEGKNILRWANLGAVVEGVLLWFVAVYLDNYNNSPVIVEGKQVGADTLALDRLRVFYNQNIWISDQKEEWDSWILQLQQYRNSVHSFKDRIVGTTAEYHISISKLKKLINDLDSRLPYPDGFYHWIDPDEEQYWQSSKV